MGLCFTLTQNWIEMFDQRDFVFVSISIPLNHAISWYWRKAWYLRYFRFLRCVKLGEQLWSMRAISSVSLALSARTVLIGRSGLTKRTAISKAADKLISSFLIAAMIFTTARRSAKPWRPLIYQENYVRTALLRLFVKFIHRLQWWN